MRVAVYLATLSTVRIWREKIEKCGRSVFRVAVVKEGTHTEGCINQRFWWASVQPAAAASVYRGPATYIHRGYSVFEGFDARGMEGLRLYKRTHTHTYTRISARNTAVGTHIYKSLCTFTERERVCVWERERADIKNPRAATTPPSFRFLQPSLLWWPSACIHTFIYMYINRVCPSPRAHTHTRIYVHVCAYKRKTNKKKLEKKEKGVAAAAERGS